MIWVDAQLSPDLAKWITQELQCPAKALREVGLRNSTDPQIFQAARKADVIVMNKDIDFVRLLEQHGSPPKLIWITCGNTSNERLIEILSVALPEALKLLQKKESMVEISDNWKV